MRSLSENENTAPNLRLGRIGVGEAASLTAIAISVNGLFGMDKELAYSKGNLTYLTIPLSIFLAFAQFLLVCRLMEKEEYFDLWELLENTLGSSLGFVAALIFAAGMVFCAASPLRSFGLALENLVYEGVEFPKLILFLIPPCTFLAYKGLETLGRTSKCYAALLIVSLVIAFISSSKGWRSYRLYPIPGIMNAWQLSFSLKDSVCFMPVFLSLLSVGKGVHGVRFARKAGTRAALISAFVCFTVQLMLGGLYTYAFLAKTDMPLCRVNYLSIERNFIMWLDKILLMIWLNGCLISSAFCIYGAAVLSAGAFSQRDSRPVAFAFSLIVSFFVLADYTSYGSPVKEIHAAISVYGFAVIMIILLLVFIADAVRLLWKGKRNDNHKLEKEN